MNDKLYVEQWLIPSKSNPEKPHTVSLKHDGEYVCGCWPFRKNRTCGHIEDVQSGLYVSEQEKQNVREPIFQYEFLMGNVTEVEVHKISGNKITFLIPLIPLDPRGTHMDATIVYDLNVKFDVPMSRIKAGMNRPILQKNSPMRVIAYVEVNGRMVWKREGEKINGVEVVPL